MIKPYLEAGEFTTTHGITGELRLYPWCDGPDFLCRFSTLYLDNAGRRPLAVEQIRPHKNICIVQLAGVTTVEAARIYIGKTVYIARAEAQLPPGVHFVQDLLNATVRDADSSEDYGTISAISHPGRHDIYEVLRPDGSISLFPATEPFLVSADAEAELVLVRPIPGMFDPPEPQKPNKPGKKHPNREDAP